MATSVSVISQPINVLKANRINARTHRKDKLRQLIDNIRTFGFTSPVLLESRNGIIVGHARVEAAKLVGMTGGADEPVVSNHDPKRTPHALFLGGFTTKGIASVLFALFVIIAPVVAHAKHPEWSTSSMCSTRERVDMSRTDVRLALEDRMKEIPQ